MRHRIGSVAGLSLIPYNMREISAEIIGKHIEYNREKENDVGWNINICFQLISYSDAEKRNYFMITRGHTILDAYCNDAILFVNVTE